MGMTMRDKDCGGEEGLENFKEIITSLNGKG
jgi:hypothetical protein